jgi:pyruvate dehydrogenase E1 component
MLAKTGQTDPDAPRQAAEKYDLHNINAGTTGNAGGDS